MLFTQLYQTYKQDVFCYLLGLTHNAHLAEDLVSETFLGALQSLPRFKGESEVKTWLFAIARNKWFAHLRRQNRRLQPDDLALVYLETAPDPQTIADNRSACLRIEQLLAEFAPRTQTIVRMRIQGHSFLEIATACKISESSARVIDHRAKQKIRTVLESEGLME